MLPIKRIKEILYKRRDAVKKLKIKLKNKKFIPINRHKWDFPNFRDVMRWENNFLLCSDLLISSNGIQIKIKE